MKKAVLLTIVVLGAGTAAWMAPAPARSASLNVPELTLIGQTGTAGSVVVVVIYQEFDKDPNIDVHTTAKNVTIRDLKVLSNGTGNGIGTMHRHYADTGCGCGCGCGCGRRRPRRPLQDRGALTPSKPDRTTDRRSSHSTRGRPRSDRTAGPFLHRGCGRHSEAARGRPCPSPE